MIRFLLGLIIILIISQINLGIVNANLSRTNENQTKEIQNLDREFKSLRVEFNKQLDETNVRLKQIQTTKAERKAVVQPTRLIASQRPVVSRPDIEAYVRQVFGDKANIALAICSAESGCREDAVSSTQDVGVYQIHLFSGYRQGLSAAQLLNYKINIDLAYRISNQGTNWTPWTTYTSGSYLRYL